MKETQNIVIRATNWVGDAVMNTPAVLAVRKAFPDSRITVLAKKWVAEVFEGNPNVDSVITLTKEDLASPSGPWHLGRRLKSEAIHRAYILPNSFSSALSVFLAGIPERIGYALQLRSLLLTQPVRATRELLSCHQVFYYLGLVPETQLTPEECHPRLYPKDKERADAKRLLEAEGVTAKETLIGIGPGAVYGSAKRYPPERFAAVIKALAKEGTRRFALFGSASEQAIAQEVADRSGVRCINLAGRTTLRELIALLEQCHLFLTNDSGAMHVAAALQVPIVAVFGSTNPDTTAPYGEGHILIRHSVSCSPCLKRECPTDFRCMLDISPEEVAAACEKQLGKPKRLGMP